jgi:hypothetical protein
MGALVGMSIADRMVRRGGRTVYDANAAILVRASTRERIAPGRRRRRARLRPARRAYGRRVAPGELPVTRLKARLNAASDPYPTR